MKLFSAIALSIVLWSSTGFAQDTATKSEVKVIDRMNFTVQTAGGEEVNFKDYLGKGPVLLTFWALWCEPCKQEMKTMKAVIERLKEKGISMVAVNTDKVKSLAKVRAYVTTQEIHIPVLVDPDGSIARDMFAMESLPYSLILNPDGSIYKKHVGFTPGDEVAVEQELLELAEKTQAK